MSVADPRISLFVAVLLVACAGDGATVTVSGDDAARAPAADGDEISDEGPSPVDTDEDSEPTDEEDPEVDDDTPEPIPLPDELSPCTTGDCWETALAGPPCSADAHDEDFSSGNYNVHSYASMAWDGVPTRITLTPSTGDWEPVLLLRAADGTTLFDGDLPLQNDDVTVDAESAVNLTVTSQTPLAIDVFVTSRATLESDFVDRIPTDVTYTVEVDSDCGDRIACTVNGNNVRDPACGWIHYVGRRVVPLLGGSRDERLHTASLVTWWALKEGVMFLENPIVYSNCNFPDGDARIGALDSCVDNRAWQVGLSGVQVPYHSDEKVEQTAQTLYPQSSIEDVLRTTAIEARLGPEDVEAVVRSGGTLRRSWLLRNSAVGFTIEAPVVESECVEDSLRWCYGTGWDTTQLYAPNRAAALGAIEDVRSLLAELAP